MVTMLRRTDRTWSYLENLNADEHLRIKIHLPNSLQWMAGSKNDDFL